jgi:hypothetical protein
MSAAVAIPQTSEVAGQPVLVPSRDRNLVPYLVTALLMFGLSHSARSSHGRFLSRSLRRLLRRSLGRHQVRSGQPAIHFQSVFAPMGACRTDTFGWREPLHTGTPNLFCVAALCVWEPFAWVAQTLQRTTHVRRLGHALVVYGSCMAVFAVLQSLSSGGNFIG